VAALSNNRKRLGEMLPENSFILASNVQMAPFSNSNKQVHLNLIHVQRSSPHSSCSSPTKSAKLQQSPTSRLRRRFGNGSGTVSTSGDNAEPTKYDYLALTQLNNGTMERYSSRNSTNASTSLSGASMLPFFSD